MLVYLLKLESVFVLLEVGAPDDQAILHDRAHEETAQLGPNASGTISQLEESPAGVIHFLSSAYACDMLGPL